MHLSVLCELCSFSRRQQTSILHLQREALRRQIQCVTTAPKKTFYPPEHFAMQTCAELAMRLALVKIAGRGQGDKQKRTSRQKHHFLFPWSDGVCFVVHDELLATFKPQSGTHLRGRREKQGGRGIARKFQNNLGNVFNMQVSLCLGLLSCCVDHRELEQLDN